MTPGPSASDAAAAWTFAALLLTVLAILGVVIQSFSLHSALARAKVHAPELAGIRLLALWLPSVAVWLAAGILLGRAQHPAVCAPADGAMLWLAALYPLTAWPAIALAARARVRLGGGYFAAQLLPPVTLLVMGGLPCL